MNKVSLIFSNSCKQGLGSLFLIILFSLNSMGQDNRIWATYYGGNAWDGDQRTDMITDAAGNVYMVGSTPSTSGISTLNSYGGGSSDGYIVKFDAGGNRLWARYFGASGADQLSGITIDGSGNLFIVGTGGSSGLVSGGFQTLYGGSGDAVLIKMDSSGSVIWSTYYGNSGGDNGTGVDLDGLGNVYLSGSTGSTSGISSGGFQNTSGGGNDAFLVKFNATTGARIWATFYGGPSNEFAGFRCKTDASNNIYIHGYTYSASGIASSGFQNSHNGGIDGFLTKFDPSGNLLWSTYYGGAGDEEQFSMSTDNLNNVYIFGRTTSTSSIASGGFQNIFGGGGLDCYITKFDANGNRIWASYYGGPGADFAWDGITDVNGNIYMAGASSSTAAISLSGFQNTNMGGTYDGFLAKFNAAGNLICSTYYGGPTMDAGLGVAKDLSGNLYLSGFTASTSGISSGGFQMTYGGGTFDNFLVKFTDYCPVLSLPGSISGNTTVCSGTSQTYSVTNDVNATSYTWNLPSGWSGSSTSNSITATAGVTSGSITVTANNACGSSTAQTLSVTVNTAPATPSTITGNATVCSGTSQTYSVTNDVTATSYTWNLPSGWTGTSTSNSITAIAGATSGNITVTANNACGSSTVQTLNVTTNTVPAQPSSITGDISVCETSTENYSVTNDVSATSYTWNLPSGWIGTSTSNSITATATATSGTITVTANNACGSSVAQTLNITVNTLPAVSVSLNVSSVCVDNAVFTLTGGSPSGGIFSGNGVTGSSFNAATAGVGTHTITYSFTDGNGCTNTNTDQITVNNCTGISDSGSQVSDLIIYPNPFANEINFENINGSVQIQFINVLGELVMQIESTSNFKQQTSNLSPGMYVLRIISGGDIITRSVVKQ